MGELMKGMDTRIGSPRTMEPNRLLMDDLKGSLKFTLHGPCILLDLPPAVICPVV
jgi:hypothetical protein